MKSASLIAVLCFAAVSARLDYEGYKLVRLWPLYDDHLEALQKLDTLSDVTYITMPVAPIRPVEVILSPKVFVPFTTKLDMLEIEHRLLSNNIGPKIQKEFRRLDKRFENPDKFAFDINDYNRLSDIESQMTRWASQCPGNKTCQINNIATTHEGRTVKVFQMHDATNPVGRKAVFVDATIHCREWIAPATILGLMEKLIEQYGSDADAKRLVDNYDWFFLPVQNPDGYEYTWNDVRMWRKNRKPVEDGCFGVDLNRNFDVGPWAQEGVSNFSCSDLYCGPSAASESEVSSVQQEFQRLARRNNQVYLESAVSLHSSGNMWMFPPGNTVNHEGAVCDRISAHDELMRVADSAADAVQATHDTVWTRGTSCAVIYPTTGGTDDYAHIRANIPYAYTLELRGPGFDPDRSNIRPSIEEVWNGMKAMINAIENKP